MIIGLFFMPNLDLQLILMNASYMNSLTDLMKWKEFRVLEDGSWTGMAIEYSGFLRLRDL